MNDNDTPTPLTDDAVIGFEYSEFPKGYEIVKADFARGLELRLYAALEELAEEIHRGIILRDQLEAPTE